MTNSPKSSQADLFERFCVLIGLQLEDFQRQIIELLFADRRETLVLLPRGNGKSTLLAALALFHLLSRSDARVVVGAAAREQASVLFDIARGMAAHPLIAKRVDITRREIRSAGGWFKVVSSDGGKQHGLILTLAIVDELHQHVNDELYTALRTGMSVKAVPDAKLWTISTAGIGEDSPLGQLHVRARALPKVKQDGYLTHAEGENFAMLEWTLPDKAEIDDMAEVKRVNPASWVTEGVLEEQREAVHDLAFRRYHANQWVAAEAPWITADAWDGCDGEPDLDTTTPTILGVDASIRRDSTVVAAVQLKDGIYHAEFRVWTPTKKHEVELEQVLEHIRAQCKEFNVQGVVYDPQFLHHSAQRLEAEEVPVVEWRQNDSHMVPATHTLHEAVMSKKLRHGGNPDARQHALNAGVKETERGLRIKKTAARGTDDAAVALAMAVEWASRTTEPPYQSPYETRGPIFV